MTLNTPISVRFSLSHRARAFLDCPVALAALGRCDRTSFTNLGTSWRGTPSDVEAVAHGLRTCPKAKEGTSRDRHQVVLRNAARRVEKSLTQAQAWAEGRVL
tara:strand:+ start:1119 stop:1424 length:306 start_codon:yes stop_codon:yes gene_type:complete